MNSRLSDLTKWMVWLAALLPLLGWWATGLFDIDEGFYGAAVGEMLRRGDWITPYYNGVPWFEKPILLYWISVPLLAVFGEDIGPRLGPVLATLLLYVAVFRACVRHLGEAAAYWTVALLSGSLLIAAAGRMMLTDPPYVLFLSVCFFLFYNSLEDSPVDRVLAGGALALAVLAKGPVAGALFILVFGIWLALHPSERRKAWGKGWLGAVGLFLLVAGAWYLPAYLQNGQVFVQEFLIKQNLGRLSGGDAAHTYSGLLNWVFYPVVLLAGCFPWILRLPWSRVPRADRKQSQFLALCWVWFGVVFVLFTLSAAKLPHYILPCIPPLAIIVGAKVAEWKANSSARAAWLEGFGWNIAGHVFLAALLNFAAFEYYRGADLNLFGRRLVIPGAHYEVHNLTKWLRVQPGEVGVFQMPRRQKDRGTGTANLQETSHPSVVFYMRRSVRLSEDPRDLLQPTPVAFVLTRKDRIKPGVQEMLRVRGFELVRQETPVPQRYYEVWRLVPFTAPEPPATPMPQSGELSVEF